MNKLAVIGGTGIVKLEGLVITEDITCDTPYGRPSSSLYMGTYAGTDIIFLLRHGDPPVIPPHKINYRANLHALKDNGVNTVIGINAVGGITPEMLPGRLVLPDQIIDYTWGREHTFFEERLTHPVHVEFTRPYNGPLRNLIIDAASATDVKILPYGTYGATQGPRLESAAEILRLERDGCNIVGMTGMPECSLARELDMAYASISLIVNRAAGKSEEEITMDLIRKNMEMATGDLIRVFNELIPGI